MRELTPISRPLYFSNVLKEVEMISDQRYSNYPYFFMVR